MRELRLPPEPPSNGALPPHSTLGIRIEEGGWPYALLDRQEAVLPQINGWGPTRNRPLHPGELCRSTWESRDLWLFTCECSVSDCGGITNPIRVDHEGDQLIWWDPAKPGQRFAVFPVKEYRRVVLAAMEAMLRNPPLGGLSWVAAVSPPTLRQLLAEARRQLR